MAVQGLPRVNVIAVAILVGALVIGWAECRANDQLGALRGHASPRPPLMPAPRIAQQWERAIVLRFGRFAGLRGPGLFWVIPFVDRVSSWIDQRTITTSFAAEQTLT